LFNNRGIPPRGTTSSTKSIQQTVRVIGRFLKSGVVDIPFLKGVNL